MSILQVLLRIEYAVVVYEAKLFSGLLVLEDCAGTATLIDLISTVVILGHLEWGVANPKEMIVNKFKAFFLIENAATLVA